jgi:hypothetical protein
MIARVSVALSCRLSTLGGSLACRTVTGGPGSGGGSDGESAGGFSRRLERVILKDSSWEGSKGSGSIDSPLSARNKSRRLLETLQDGTGSFLFRSLFALSLSHLP